MLLLRRGLPCSNDAHIAGAATSHFAGALAELRRVVSRENYVWAIGEIVRQSNQVPPSA